MHVVNFYDADDALIAGATKFLGDGLRQGEVVLALATEPHRQAVASALRQEGFDLDALEDDGLYTALDAPTVMRSFMVDGSVDYELARQSVRPFALAAAAKRRPIRAFGEIVSLMLQNGQLEEALVIEQIRSDLAREFGASLYCAYPSRLLHEAESLHVLGELCDMHSDVVAPSSYGEQSLGVTPVSVSAQSFLPVVDAIRAARNFVVASIRGWDVSQLLVGTAAVAVVQVLTQVFDAHMRAFRVALSPAGSGVRVQIEYPVDAADGELSRFGAFGLLDRVTKEWGAEHNRDTRVIWAVFS